MKRNIRWIVIAVSIYAIASLAGSVADLFGRRTVVEKEKERLTGLEKKREELTKKLELVRTPWFVEKEARERLGMAKEGDTVIIMDSSSLPSSGNPEIPKSDASGQLPYWKRWWRIFF